MSLSPQTIGKHGEECAATCLQKKGYTIIDRNVQTGSGEVDIIARDGDTYVFVEVKSLRRSSTYQPSWRVNPQKVGRLRSAVHAWLDEQGHDVAVRIDVIGVCAGEVVEHYEDVGW